MSYEELISWSNQESRPEWQKDALRRLATTGELTAADLSALRRIVEKTSELIVDEVIAAIPLEAEHLADTESDAPRTILGAIGPVRYVDRLASDQPAIRFAKQGVTLVYGANASGKSGYCRIAKQLCRSHSHQELKGNVLEPPTVNQPEVDVVYGIEGSDPKRQTATWRSGDPSPAALARISVFDTATARVYVDKDRKVEFLPYELDLLNKLAVAAKELDSNFEADENAINAAIRTPLPTGFARGTPVSLVLAKLVPETPKSNLPTELELRNLAIWNDEGKAELQKINDEIRNDPQMWLRTYKSAKQELQNMHAEFAGHLSILGDAAIASIKDSYLDMTAKSAIAKATAKGLGVGMPISEIGSEYWQKMLLFAREFAGEAFPDSDNPKLVTSETCVLCQQHLENDAAARMVKFDDYISGRAATDSEEAKRRYDTLVTRISNLDLNTSDQITALLSVYSGISDANQAFADEIAQAYVFLSLRLEKTKAMITDGVFAETDAFQIIEENLIQRIDVALTELQERIEGLENLCSNAERLNDLESKKAALEDTKKLSEVIETVVARLKKLEGRLKIKEARKICSSSPIASQLTKRRRAVLTETLKEKLKYELETLKLSHVPLDMKDRSNGADSVIKVGLAAHQRVSNNSDVLSEGEQRALALSCFLAELTEVGAKHSIIIDDPVSSLDHSRVEAVAKRLVVEAIAGRQVIIFTHNIMFHYMIENEARRADVPCHTEWMSSLGGTKFGIIDDSGQPPHTKKVKSRIHELNEAKARLYRDGYDPADQRFRDALTSIYTMMRETWERIVEEILFNGTINRFRPDVMTLSLKHACYFPEEDYPAIYEGMKRCSHFSGHDRAAELPQEFPAKHAIDADLQALIEFYKKVSERKTILEKNHKYEEGPQPEFL